MKQGQRGNSLDHGGADIELSLGDKLKPAIGGDNMAKRGRIGTIARIGRRSAFCARSRGICAAPKRYRTGRQATAGLAGYRCIRG
jgi:hypothetical protein